MVRPRVCHVEEEAEPVEAKQADREFREAERVDIRLVEGSSCYRGAKFVENG